MTNSPATAPDRPLHPASVPFDAVGTARHLLRTLRSGAIATLAPAGHPFASLVNMATAHDGAPILLLSQLAAHTRQLDADARCSLLMSQGGKGDPLAHPRLTLSGTARRDPDPRLRDRFLRRHPKSALYADFPDFAFWIIDIASAHLNGGFAKAATLSAHDLLLPVANSFSLLAAEDEAVAHMNEDHAQALRLYATELAGEPDGPWRATGLDPEGLDLAWADRTARIIFPVPPDGPGALRRTLAELAKSARAHAATRQAAES